MEIHLPGNFVIYPSYWTAGAIVFLLFLLILTLGQFRRRLLDWHMKGFIPGIIFGLILTVLLEGFLLLSGKTVLTEVLSWQNAPQPFASAIDTSKEKLVNVLGVESGNECEFTVSQLKRAIEVIPPSEKQKLLGEICSEY